MRQNMSWALAVLAFGFGFVSVANGQEGRPVGERPEASTRRTQRAEPESPVTRGVTAQGNQGAAPRLVKISGVLTEFVRNSVSSSVEMTFAVYKDELGGEALWTETQSLEVDKEGRYTVLLGAAQADGVPVELFPAGEPRWLGVEIRGQAPQSRTLLVSVPYALKALDAEKLSGKSLSDFVLSDSLGDQVRRVVEGQTIVANQATSTGTAQPGQAKASSAASSPTTAAGPMFPPSTFSGTNATQIVAVQQNGSGNGLYAQTASSSGSSVFAVANATTGSASGVIGVTNGGGAGVIGVTHAASCCTNGVYGQSINGSGVFGDATASSGFAVGVTGQTASTSGQGVSGIAHALTGSATGVYGDTESANGTGVFGVANATTGNASGVIGVTNNSGAGVIGVTNSTSVGTNGVYGQSINGNGVQGEATASSGYAVGVNGQTESTSGDGVSGTAHALTGFANGVYGQTASTNGNGVIGVATATSGSPNGVFGQTSSTNGAGVVGIATATTGFNSGFYGNTASDEGYAVHGDAVNTAGNAVGMFGTSVGTNGGIGVWGVSRGTSGFGVGVRGDLEEPTASGAAGFFITFSPTSEAGQFVNASRQGLILQGLSGPFDATQKEVFRVDASGNLHITGNLTVDGTKSSTAKLQDGREVALYAVESPENWFEDFGSGELNNGVAWVPLDASFAQAVNSAVSYHVFLTPTGDSNGLYVARKTAAGFEIREHGGGGSNVAFDYRIVVRRRGYETTRMAEVHHDTRIQELSRQHFRSLNSSEIIESAGAMRKAPIIPATRPTIPRPVVPEVPRVNVPQTPKVTVPQPHQPR